MVVAGSVRATCAVCALLLTWLSAFTCAAQHDSSRDPQPAAKTQLSRVFKLRYESPRDSAANKPERAWLWAAAGTTMAFAAGYLTTEGVVYKASHNRVSALERSRDAGLSLDMRLQAEGQASAARDRADLFDRISDICLAGSVAATGATLLIWLTSKHRRRDRQQRNVLLGPMVLRGASGGGLVLREKF